MENPANASPEDALLQGMLDEGGIIGFFEKIFAFLNNETGFYRNAILNEDLREEFVTCVMERFEDPLPEPNPVIGEAPLFSPREYRNGAVHPTYCWNQTLQKLQLFCKLPPNVRNVDLQVLCSTSSFTLLNHGDVIFSEHFVRNIKENFAMYRVDNRGRFVIIFDKRHPIMWEKLFMFEEPEEESEDEPER